MVRVKGSSGCPSHEAVMVEENFPKDPPAGHFVRKPNRLVNEKSPYLLQHAENPVYWYPWGEEAVSRAACEDKPVFLSIGYATCHWCHVMAHESFEDPEVAALLNRDFIAIKVDREERPDIDSVYMAVCQQLAGQGGWPLTIVMTPDKKPFLAATYIPKETRFSRQGLLTLLPSIITAWKNQRMNLIRSAEQVIAAIASPGIPSSRTEPGSEFMDEAYQSLLIEFDTVNGGFGRAPKFPAPHTLLFLLRYGAKHPNSHAFAMAETTLTAIRNGGIYDHLAGGIHRYSTDARWLVPHFEKMLYDQALLVMACTEAYQASGNNVYRRTVEKIIGYVLHSLRSPEGAFYVWTLREIEQLLGNGDAAIAALVFDLTAEGNYHDAERGHGFNILHRPQPLENIAASLKVPREELELRVATIASRLLKARGERARPSLDDKVLADWNGLWIAALALAGRVFDNPGWIDAAKTTLNFILSHMRSEDGGLLHRYREGEAAIPGFADDYACIIHALIELYETTFDPPLLRTAVELNQYLSAHFHDAHEGGYFTVSDTAEALIVRKKEIYDGAIPSCNSVAFMNLIRLSRLTGDAQFEERASARLVSHPLLIPGSCAGSIFSKIRPMMSLSWEQKSRRIPVRWYLQCGRGISHHYSSCDSHRAPRQSPWQILPPLPGISP